MVRTAQAVEVSSTTSMPGPCSGPQTTPAILEYQPAEKIRECACINIKVCTYCSGCAHLQNMCTSVTLCAQYVTFVHTYQLKKLINYHVPGMLSS